MKPGIPSKLRHTLLVVGAILAIAGFCWTAFAPQMVYVTAFFFGIGVAALIFYTQTRNE
jgi:hypothetical protein